MRESTPALSSIKGTCLLTIVTGKKPKRAQNNVGGNFIHFFAQYIVGGGHFQVHRGHIFTFTCKYKSWFDISGLLAMFTFHI